jgi:hypothetical protein
MTGATGHIDCRKIEHFEASAREQLPGRQLILIRKEAEAFRKWFAHNGMPDFVRSYNLVSLPYPTQFGLWRACKAVSPFVTLTNRLIVVRWTEMGGRTKTLLFEPSDYQLGFNTPYFAELVKKSPKIAQLGLVKKHSTVERIMRRLRIDPADVDYLAFDHLQTQDVRRWIGTLNPAPDLNAHEPVRPFFPNAKLIVQKSELDSLDQLHPLQEPWYQGATYTDLDPGKIVAITGDVMLGPGVALLSTPGHSSGNQTLVLNTVNGIWALSENAISAECLSPELSKIAGLSEWAEEWGQEVVLNSNTLEGTASQYNSLIKEKTIVDFSRKNPNFLQFFPTSELSANIFCPGVAPTFKHGEIRHGHLRMYNEAEETLEPAAM